MSMILNGYTFPWDPDFWTIPLEEKYAATVLTWESFAFFSFGTSILGKQIVLRWKWMSAAQFNQLHAIVMLDTSVSWIPGDGYNYTVEILPPLRGDYCESGGLGFPWRDNVEMTLVISSRTVAS